MAVTRLAAVRAGAGADALPAEEGRDLDPPLRIAWSVNTHGLIEFPPAVANGVAYVVNKFGNGKAVRLSDRKVLWEVKDHRNKGKPNYVTAPVYYAGRVFGAFLGGTVVAGDAKTGKRLEARAPRPPRILAARRRRNLYLGTDTTDVVALRTADGGHALALQLARGDQSQPQLPRRPHLRRRLRELDVRARSGAGKPLWRTNTSKAPPDGEGGFFSSPAVGFGRVYAARDDGIVFAFDEKTGKVDWAFPTGGPVYGSPAIAQSPAPRRPSTSAPKTAASTRSTPAAASRAGTRRRRPDPRHRDGHRPHRLHLELQDPGDVGIDVRTHRQTFHLNQAGYTPVVSDGRRLFLVGYFSVFGLEPTKP